MRVIRSIKPRMSGGAKPRAPQPPPSEPLEEGAPVPGPDRGPGGESNERQLELEEGPGDEDLVPDE